MPILCHEWLKSHFNLNDDVWKIMIIVRNKRVDPTDKLIRVRRSELNTPHWFHDKTEGWTDYMTDAMKKWIRNHCKVPKKIYIYYVNVKIIS